jgi:hypothetical protein
LIKAWRSKLYRLEKLDTETEEEVRAPMKIQGGPLSGYRIIEIAGIGPGPLCCALLSDIGADIIRIDRLEPSGLGIDYASVKADVRRRGR